MLTSNQVALHETIKHTVFNVEQILSSSIDTLNCSKLDEDVQEILLILMHEESGSGRTLQ